MAKGVSEGTFLPPASSRLHYQLTYFFKIRRKEKPFLYPLFHYCFRPPSSLCLIKYFFPNRNPTTRLSPISVHAPPRGRQRWSSWVLHALVDPHDLLPGSFCQLYEAPKLVDGAAVEEMSDEEVPAFGEVPFDGVGLLLDISAIGFAVEPVLDIDGPINDAGARVEDFEALSGESSVGSVRRTEVLRVDAEDVLCGFVAAANLEVHLCDLRNRLDLGVAVRVQRDLVAIGGSVLC